VKHQDTHPTLDVAGCFACKIASVGFGVSAMPTRKPQEHGTIAKERLLDRDLDAYKRLRGDGVQPRQIDGSARVEARADERHQVETGLV
jgi:hypothetical protein